jgi:hypothetical protein
MHDDRKRGGGGDRQKTWKEIDALRDKSRERDRDPMEKKSSPVAMQAQKSYRAALEKAFQQGTLGELAKTLSRSSEEPKKTVSMPAPTPPPTNSAPIMPKDAAPEPPKDPERENRMKMLMKIREAEGRDPITKAVDAFLAKFPKLPDDFEILTKCLAHKDDDRIVGALEQLTGMLAREKPRRGRTLLAQLRFIEETHGDPAIRTQAGALKGKL